MINLYVGNLSYDTTETDLRSVFEPYGEVANASIIQDRMAGRSRGFGFVEMPDATQAKAAIAALNGQDLLGRKLTVNEARPRTDQRNGDRGGSRS